MYFVNDLGERFVVFNEDKYWDDFIKYFESDSYNQISQEEAEKL